MHVSENVDTLVNILFKRKLKHVSKKDVSVTALVYSLLKHERMYYQSLFAESQKNILGMIIRKGRGEKL